jgi:hypothetical protein
VDSELSEIGWEQSFCKKTGGWGQGDTKLTSMESVIEFLLFERERMASIFLK